MVPGASCLPTERKAYYDRLSDRLIEMCYAAVNAGDWERVEQCAKRHILLNKYALFEVFFYEHRVFNGAIETLLEPIDHFCKEDGWI